MQDTKQQEPEEQPQADQQEPEGQGAEQAGYTHVLELRIVHAAPGARPPVLEVTMPIVAWSLAEGAHDKDPQRNMGRLTWELPRSGIMVVEGDPDKGDVQDELPMASAGGVTSD